MTISDKKEAVRQAIIKAVPGILDLKPGCEIEGGGLIVRNGWVYWNTREGDFLIDNYDWDEDTKIIGRPITLATVLIAYTNQVRVNPSNPVFEIQIEMVQEMYGKISGMWKLKDDDFDHQSEETISFLHELLCE